MDRKVKYGAGLGGLISMAIGVIMPMIGVSIPESFAPSIGAVVTTVISWIVKSTTGDAADGPDGRGER